MLIDQFQYLPQYALFSLPGPRLAIWQKVSERTARHMVVTGTFPPTMKVQIIDGWTITPLEYRACECKPVSPRKAP